MTDEFWTSGRLISAATDHRQARQLQVALRDYQFMKKSAGGTRQPDFEHMNYQPNSASDYARHSGNPWPKYMERLPPILSESSAVVPPAPVTANPQTPIPVRSALVFPRNDAVTHHLEHQQRS